MSKYNGSGILLYADGVEIAAQKGFSVNLSQNLFPTTTKQSGGWAEHGNGLRSSDVPFENLMSTTGLSDKELYNYINTRRSLVLSILGFTYPYVMEVDLSNMTISAPTEEAVGLSGTFVAQGKILHLKGGSAQLFTSLSNTDYDTFTTSGTRIMSAINAAGGASGVSGNMAVVTLSIYKVFVSLTVVSGETPSVELINSGGASISNKVKLIAGANIVTLITTGADAAGKLKISNTAAANFSTSNIYCAKQ